MPAGSAKQPAAVPLYRTQIPDDSDVTDFLRAMREDEDLKAMGLDTLTDLEIYKFLVGEKYDPESARGMIVKCLEWRRDNDFEAMKSADYSDLPVTNTVAVHPVASRRGGYTILLWRQRYIVPCADDAAVHRSTAYIMQKVWKLLHSGSASDRLLVVVDRGGATSSHRDIALSRYLVGAMKVNFPEVLEQCLVLPSSWFVGTLWAMVKPFLDPLTAEKIKFATESEAKDRLLEHLPIEYIPRTLGGTWDSEPAPVPLRAKAAGATGSQIVGKPAAAEAPAAAADRDEVVVVRA